MGSTDRDKMRCRQPWHGSMSRGNLEAMPADRYPLDQVKDRDAGEKEHDNNKGGAKGQGKLLTPSPQQSTPTLFSPENCSNPLFPLSGFPTVHFDRRIRERTIGAEYSFYIVVAPYNDKTVEVKFWG